MPVVLTVDAAVGAAESLHSRHFRPVVVVVVVAVALVVVPAVAAVVVVIAAASESAAGLVRSDPVSG